MSETIGNQLRESGRGEVAAAARALGVSRRTLSRWIRRAREGEPAPAWGRPRHPEAARRRAEDLVTREREAQGRVAGWRPIEEALRRREDVVPRKLLQRALSEQKQAERRAESARWRALRVSHDVLARDGIWAQDAADLGDGVHSEVAKDRASTAIRGLALGPPAKARDVVALLEAMRRRDGGLPLVWQTDNGSAYTCEEVRVYLGLHRIIHLRSRVHTPTDNPAIERGIGELKAELLGAPPTPQNVARACVKLDHGRLRASRGYRTAGEVDASLPRAEHLVDRETFYAEACSAIESAVQSQRTARARRKAERAAIWSVLEKYGVARQRGPAETAGPPYPAAPRSEIG